MSTQIAYIEVLIIVINFMTAALKEKGSELRESETLFDLLLNTRTIVLINIWKNRNFSMV